MRILGIDPGLATCGIGLIETQANNRYKAVDWLTITTEKNDMSERLRELSDDLSSYMQETRPELIVIEKLYFSVNKKTAMDIAHARGALLLTASRFVSHIIEPNPMELKSAITGDGRADKKQMQEMIKRILKLDEIPTPDDAADALCLAVFGALTYATKLTAPLAKDHTAASTFEGKWVVVKNT